MEIPLIVSFRGIASNSINVWELNKTDAVHPLQERRSELHETNDDYPAIQRIIDDHWEDRRRAQRSPYKKKWHSDITRMPSSCVCM